MTAKKLNILHLEDLQSDADLAMIELRKTLGDHTVKLVDTEADFVQALEDQIPDLIISDFKLPSFDGLSALKIAKRKAPFTPFVMLTGSQNEDTAVDCLKAGADDYVIKEHIKRLGSAVINALEKKKNERDRQQAEESLRESQAFNKTLLDTSPDLIYIYDIVEKKNIYSNQRIVNILEYSIEEIQDMGENILPSLMHPDDFNNYLKTILPRYQTAKDGEFIEHEYRMKHKQGNWIWLQSKESIFLRQADGQPQQIFGLTADITERKQSEDSLRKSEHKFRLLADYTYDWEYWIDQEGHYIYMSTACERITGHRAEEFLSNPDLVFQLVRPDYVDKVRSHYLDENNKDTPPISMEFTITTKNGEERVLEHNCTAVFDSEGNYLGRRGNNRDITERIGAESERANLEEQLRQSQKLEAVGTMAGGIAHDFNNILQGLYLYSDIIKDQLPKDEELRANFQHIIESGERARDLVQQILTFSRKAETDLRPIKIQNIIKNALKLTRASTPTIIEIKQSIDTNCGTTLCDSTHFHQVFVNICNNAIQAMMEKGGTLSISLLKSDSKIEIEPGSFVPTPHGVSELQISDTGHGMNTETLEKIFDPFFTTKDVGEGTGLGLSIVHGIIKDFKGQIIVESKLSEGTTFRILLPVSDEEEFQEDRPLYSRDELKGMRILLVDDDEMISGAGKYILEDQGYQVDIANNGQEALDKFKTDISAYDLIITDLTMPNMTGMELGAEIRKRSKDVALILTSGNLDTMLQREFKKLGFNGYISKPWTIDELLNAIHELSMT